MTKIYWVVSWEELRCTSHRETAALWLAERNLTTAHVCHLSTLKQQTTQTKYRLLLSLQYDYDTICLNVTSAQKLTNRYRRTIRDKQDTSYQDTSDPRHFEPSKFVPKCPDTYNLLAVSTRPPGSGRSKLLSRPCGPLQYSVGPCGPLSGGGKEFY